MRILVFSWRDLAHPHAGGAEVYTHEVARHWVAAGHEVTLLTSGAENLQPETERDGIQIIRRGGRHSVYREAKQFYKREAKGKYDLVIDQINTRPFLCPRFVNDAPVLALIHQVAREVWFYETTPPVAVFGRYLLEPQWLRTYREVPTVTVSESTKRSLQGYGLRKVKVVPEGYAQLPHGPRRSREDRPTIIYVGRFSRNKRPHHVVRAFQHARRSLPDLQLWMVGSGPMERSLQRRGRQDVTFFGRVDQQTKVELLTRAHVLLMASVREGWGLVVTEAASLGTPTVAYGVDGLRDSVAASGGVLTACSPAALGDGAVRILSGDLAMRSVRAGGVRPWPAVAESLLDCARTSFDDIQSSTESPCEDRLGTGAAC